MDAPSQLVPSSMVIDDLKLIRGIGPGIESRLNDAGIFTYAQLADCTPAYLAELFSGLTGMSVHRIQEKDFIGQARRKASETKPVNTDMDPNVSEIRQHYATFVITLLLDENNSVRQTRVKYVQNQKELPWAGWNIDRLVDFMRDNAGFVITQTQKPKTPAMTDLSGKQETALPENKQRGTLHVREMNIWPKGSVQPQTMLIAGSPYKITVLLELSGLSDAEKEKFAYSATIFARKLGGKLQLIAGEAQGELVPAERIRLDVEGRDIPCGDYRLETLVVTFPPGKDQHDIHRLSAWMEGNLLQVC